MAQVIIDDAERLVTKDVPESGQVYVGDDLAGSTVRVAIEVVEENDDGDELEYADPSEAFADAPDE
jgi:hypothetical protein